MAVEPRERYRIWLRYSDGTEGEVDLSHLVGKGVFVAFRDRSFFERVHIADVGAIAWSEEIDMCARTLYLEITGKSPGIEDATPGVATSAGSPAVPGAATASEPDPLRPVAVKARDGYRIWLRYADGVEGEADLSDLAGEGVFTAWLDRAFFENVRVAEGGEIAWGNDIDLCRHALYLRVTGKAPHEVFAGLREEPDA